MILTPDQASRTWCPMARIVRRETHSNEKTPNRIDEIVAGVNRYALGGDRAVAFPHSCRCLSDKCAMWRWADPAPFVERTTASIHAQANRRGYCGLAGVVAITD